MTDSDIKAAYSDAETASVYDALNPWDAADDCCLALAGDTAASVLDLGCGTGTLACALAQVGHRVTAVDPSQHMLDHARGKAGYDAVAWHCATAEAWQCDATFDLITFTGNAFQCLRTDDAVNRVFDQVSRWLSPGGRFVFNTRNPAIDWVATWHGREVDIALANGQRLTEHTDAYALDGTRLRVTQRYQLGEQQFAHTDDLFFMPADGIRVPVRSRTQGRPALGRLAAMRV